MIADLRKIWVLLSVSEKKAASLVLLSMLLVAVIETLSFATIMPFLSVLGNPGLIHSNIFLSRSFNWLGFTSQNKFIVFLGIFALASLLANAISRAGMQYVVARFSEMRRHSLSCRLLSKYLQQPYVFFLRQNSSYFTKAILSESDQLVYHCINPALNFIVYSLTAVAIITLLFVADPVLAAILTGSFFVFYFVMFITVRRSLARIGRELQVVNSQRFKAVSETFGGIKELKLLGREETCLHNFQKPSMIYSQFQVRARVLGVAPQYLIEVVAFGAVLCIIVYSMGRGSGDLGQILPVAGLYVLGALRLRPALNQIFLSASLLRLGRAFLDNIGGELENECRASREIFNNKERLPLTRELILENVKFTYHGAGQPVVDDINLRLPANSSIGIIGASGAGKTTLIDLILGLLIPEKGCLLVDGVSLSRENLRKWQNNIGYVPQHIFLADDSIESNIAFGVPAEEIDKEAVEKAAKMAQIHDFVLSLSRGYKTEVGERGIRLSGGQRQRIGIARALYHEPDLLVLDEATSALDNATEAEVMNAINAISGKKTIIMIAHRLTTVENCRMIVKIQDGRATISTNH